MKMILTINKSSFPSYYEFLWEVKHSSSYKFNICRKFEEYNIIDHRPVYDAIREYNYESLRFCNIT